MLGRWMGGIAVTPDTTGGFRSPFRHWMGGVCAVTEVVSFKGGIPHTLRMRDYTRPERPTNRDELIELLEIILMAGIID